MNKRNTLIIAPFIFIIFSIFLLIFLKTPAIASTNNTPITFNHNSYIYNKNGKRIMKNKKYLKNESTIAKGRIVKLSKNKKYYTLYYSSGKITKLWLPYTIINKHAYYNIKDNEYIKVANVKSINNQELIATSGKIIIKKDTYFYDINGNKTKERVAKNTILKVNGLFNLKPNWPQGRNFYRVYGTNHYLLIYDVIQPRTPLLLQSKESI
ncbi:SLAP domain-containing protein [Lactobacillus sp. LL6]|uniref:SLAP domain-containing protein n=1 Tax=Lactobacillus sp. LL6 TaxID=2596827 RepID=UPI001184FD7F|nr:SLAP domain-containing protein [Lactobacillus sp. LL6]TSO26931.1 hypothetical protein FOD82_07885 [Lactobacillus sp. LL6]